MTGLAALIQVVGELKQIQAFSRSEEGLNLFCREDWTMFEPFY
jgi:hypothetical protein